MHITQQRIVKSQINILSFPGSRIKGVKQLTKPFQARTRMYPSIVLLFRYPASRAGSDCAVRRQQSSNGSSASGSQVCVVFPTALLNMMHYECTHKPRIVVQFRNLLL